MACPLGHTDPRLLSLSDSIQLEIGWLGKLLLAFCNLLTVAHTLVTAESAWRDAVNNRANNR